MNEEQIKKRSDILKLLDDFMQWLMKYGYTDTDWFQEEPFAIEEYMKESTYIKKVLYGECAKNYLFR